MTPTTEVEFVDSKLIAGFEQPEDFNYGRILMAIGDRPWAITPTALATILQVVHHPTHGEADLSALAARIGKPLENGGSRVQRRDDTAILEVEGPLFRYANVMTRVSGATSIQQLALDLRSAMDDPAVKRVVLSINSPGGQVDGINEMADMIREYDKEKPITAYVGGLAGSGGYWLAAAARRIVANESAQLGSIGVLATFIDNREAQRRQGVSQYDVVSSQSPLKRTDPATDEGRAQVQEMVDAMADLFIGRVAAFRNVTTDKVAREFGRGGIMPARKAIALGMADSLGSLEGLLREDDDRKRVSAPMRQAPQPPGIPQLGQKAAAPFDEEELGEGTEESDLNDQHDCTCPEGEPCECGNEDEPEGEEPDMQDEKVQADRQRIAAIMTCDEARGREDLARMLALETNHDVDRAKAILQAAPKASSLDTRMAAAPNPVVGVGGTTTGTGAEDTSAAAEVQRILAFVPDHLKYPAVRKQPPQPQPRQ
jgi:signal peptide peptidase SppA